MLHNVLLSNNRFPIKMSNISTKHVLGMCQTLRNHRFQLQVKYHINSPLNRAKFPNYASTQRSGAGRSHYNPGHMSSPKYPTITTPQ